MKNLHIKLILLLNILFIWGISSELFSQRNTVWLRGASQTSNGWGQMQQELKAKGFLFDDLIDATYNSGLGVIEAANQVETMIGNNENVLGIAHDYGGIVLRDLQLQDPSISAMILDGVPNQGSTAISNSIPGDPGSVSRARILAEASQLIRRDDDCDNCGMLEAFESWIETIENGAEFLDDIQHNSPIINNLESPTVSFAILWGSQENLSLNRMMSSRANPSDDDTFGRCFRTFLNRERTEAMDATTRATITNTQGFFANFINFVTSASTSGPNFLTQITTFISNSNTNITNQINALKEEEQELARILRCELSNQYAAIEWQLLLLENSEREEIEVEVPTTNPEHAICISECEIDMAFGDWTSNESCEESCMDLAGSSTQLVTALVSPLTDGLLTEFEQKLDGQVKEYHLINTNHFQETHFDSPALDALEGLFKGEAGASFMVPN